jgi:uncharacterized protein YyaL (SSP411 family)
VAGVYAADPGRVRQATGSLTEAVRAALAAPAPTGQVPGRAEVEAAVSQAARLYDPAHGGLRRAPQFPSSFPVRLLLRHHRRTGEARSLEMACTTLEKMAAGGLHDQLAGGFHRYSTDERWLVPHFEKMLYDNALLAVAYVEAWQATGRADFARVARSTLDYLVRDLASPEGGLYSATDADSEGEEGRCFTWSLAEVEAVLGEAAPRFARFFGVRPEGNWEGVNVLHVPAPDEAEWAALAPARARLLAVRDRRIQPLRDDKVLASWNGLAISALAFGGRALAEPRWVAAAERAAAHVLERMVVDGRLQRSWLDGAAGTPAFLDDHAFLADGLLDLYEATFAPRWLSAALGLAERLDVLFGDPEGGGWFTTAADHERLLVREKPTHDGAEPSGGSVAVRVMQRLAAFTGEERWHRLAARGLAQAAPTLAAAPLSLHELLLSVDATLGPTPEVVLVWPAGAPPPEGMLAVLRRTFLPARALLGAAEGAPLGALAALTPIVAGKAAVGGSPTAWVCERGACRLPVTTPEALESALRSV